MRTSKSSRLLSWNNEVLAWKMTYMIKQLSKQLLNHFISIDKLINELITAVLGLGSRKIMASPSQWQQLSYDFKILILSITQCVQFTLTENKDKQQTFTIRKLEPANVSYRSSSNFHNHRSATEDFRSSIWNFTEKKLHPTLAN